ncbi:Nolc1 protein [Lasiodiplodia theobromae]|uniref:Nolc1 protein n=1 Tax=Lasiodiplodia theobromae TaxID=45133 RepID=UPI0015C30EAE|nr:Nolc1 protein [Lasiodiplodia theobromae]KAF4539017.1 Nolc1 protein [Lasiodiplodia theobromae]
MSLNCYSPTKRRVASPKKSSTKVPEDEKPYAALDETQRSHAYRYIGNNFYREQVDRENASKMQQRGQTESASTDIRSEEKSLPPEPDINSPPATTITTFMMQMNQPQSPPKHEELKLVPNSEAEPMATDRALIESRSEGRLFRMMSQRTDSPMDASLSSSGDDTPPNVPRQHFAKHPAHRRKVSLPGNTKTSSSKDLRKPGKLSFTIPGIKAPASSSAVGNQSNALVELDIPSKAAKFLGTSTTADAHNSSSKWTLNLNRRKAQRKRANTTSSLPETTLEQDDKDLTALPPVFPASISAEPDRKTAFEDSTVRIAIDSYSNSRRFAPQESNPSLPPTPPAKDTPPHIRTALDALAGKNRGGMSGLGIDTADECDEILSIDFGEKARKDEKGPATWFKHGAAEYARLIEISPSLQSLQASVIGSPTSNMYSGETPRPDGLRPDGLRWDGLTKEGYLPQMAYKPNNYSPSVYSTLFKTPDLKERGKRPHSFKATPALHTIVDSSPPCGDLASSKLNDRANADDSPSSKKSLPVVYRLSQGEFAIEDENGTQVADEKSHIACPPRTSSLNWTKKPPPGARLSLIPTKLRHALAASDISITSPNRIVDRASSNMANVRDDPQRTSYDGAAERKPASSSTEPQTDGSNPNAPHGGQSSDHAFQPSIGLTPYLAQQLGDNPNPITPGFHHPSAVPSPLAPFLPTIQPTMPTHEQLLTHFHVLHYHIEETFRTFSDVQKLTKEEIVGNSEKFFSEIRSTMDEYFADVRSHLNAIEHNMGRAIGETENLKSTLDANSRSMDDHVFKPLRKITNQNCELIKKLSSVEERVNQLEKKLETSPPAVGSTDRNGQGQNRTNMDGVARQWGNYDASHHMLTGGQQQDRQPYTDVGGRYYNGQDGYYSGTSYNYVRSGTRF